MNANQPKRAKPWEGVEEDSPNGEFMPQPNKFALPRELRWKALNWAGAAKVDPRTVADYITGRRNPRPAQREAIERVLRDNGRLDLIRAEGA